MKEYHGKNILTIHFLFLKLNIDELILEFDFTYHKYQLLENYNNFDICFKILLIGDSNIDKSYLHKFSGITIIRIDFMSFGIKIDDKNYQTSNLKLCWTRKV